MRPSTGPIPIALLLLLACAPPARAADGRRTLRLAGWTLLGAGALSFAGAGLARPGHAAAAAASPSTWLMASGLVSTGGGLWFAWHGSRMASMPDAGRVRPPGLDLAAGLDPKRGSDLGVRLPLWRVRF